VFKIPEACIDDPVVFAAKIKAALEWEGPKVSMDELQSLFTFAGLGRSYTEIYTDILQPESMA
jgi:hypothetical protein